MSTPPTQMMSLPALSIISIMEVALVILSLIFWDEVRAQRNKDVENYLPKKQCDTMHVLASSFRGIYILL